VVGISSCIAILMALSIPFTKSPVTAAALGVAGAVFFVGSLLLLSIGVLGEYVGRVYDEVRNRPLSLISRVHRPQIQIATQVGMLAVQNGSFAIPTETYPDREVTQAA
jgi:polyisoprenyl-phosphate glycosyltransferase